MRILLSSALGLVGILILGGQLLPLGESYIKTEILKMNAKSLISPVPGAYKRDIGSEFAYWDPGSSYFNNLIAQAGSVSRQVEFVNNQASRVSKFTVNKSYTNPMKISIPALGINKINISSNVESYDENVYNLVLKNGVAHFKGTPLPGDGGNSFIYGHSAVESYFTRHQADPETIFTKLEDIEIGDSVEILRDNKTYSYVVRKKKVVSPTDFSILEPQGLKETVTLMTCTPAGIGTERLIVIAERV